MVLERDRFDEIRRSIKQRTTTSITSSILGTMGQAPTGPTAGLGRLSPTEPFMDPGQPLDVNDLPAGDASLPGQMPSDQPDPGDIPVGDQPPDNGVPPGGMLPGDVTQPPPAAMPPPTTITPPVATPGPAPMPPVTMPQPPVDVTPPVVTPITPPPPTAPGLPPAVERDISNFTRVSVVKIENVVNEAGLTDVITTFNKEVRGPIHINIWAFDQNSGTWMLFASTRMVRRGQFDAIIRTEDPTKNYTRASFVTYGPAGLRPIVEFGDNFLLPPGGVQSIGVQNFFNARRLTDVIV